MAQLGAKGHKALAANVSARRCSIAFGRGSSIAHAPVGARLSSTDNGKPSFKGQMMQGITQRMAKEKADRERMERERQTSAPARNAATSFVILFAAAVAYYMGTKLPRDPDPASTVPLSGAPQLRQVAAVEILDDAQMRCINQAGMTTRQWKEAPTLFFKFAGTPAAVKEQVALVQTIAKGAGSTSFDFAKNADEQAELWSARKEALWSTAAVKQDGDHIWTSDVAVPISRLPDIIEETKRDMKESGLFGTIVGHVGDGNFHTILVYNDQQRKAAVDFEHRMVKRAIEMEGTVTGEHGVGLVKRDYLPHELGDPAVDLMRKMKLAFDPLCLLNCDKIIRMQKPKAGEVGEW
ncbi:D-lactate dehydrogenase [Magnaporthiopsis poae ATCC 64411]|uniref:D-lactate dehydrogenase (cytochrome) n=1 Tax=Magnaporthiopsis poae (strain ATCC 64411 / 73-15) TaxID=644358 RepID=A0A0C4DL02_MAGP6|nr:D-lactate dehydrogenase [Magnaporthiopsis poae ATCC 64411]